MTRYPTRLIGALSLIGTLATFAPLGCERPATSAAATLPDESPRTTVEKLIAARKHGQYRDFEGLVIASRRDELVNTLLAVDGFLSANQLLCDYVRDHFTAGLSQSIDQSFWGTNLGLFSRYVEIVSDRIEGERAIVSFTVEGKIPLRHAELTIVDGRWRYDPGNGFDSRLPTAFRQMAKGLRQVLDDLKAGRLSADLVNSQPEKLIEEVRVRLQSGAKLLPRPNEEEGG